MMLYRGTPFTKHSLIEENAIKQDEAYFKKSDVKSNFFEALYERILGEKIDLIVYTKASWNNDELLSFHRIHYPGINYFVENSIGDFIFETTIVVNGTIKGRKITKYDKSWREDIEQSFDEQFQLIEYRQFYYEFDARTYLKEKIFFPSSWQISEEKHN